MATPRLSPCCCYALIRAVDQVREFDSLEAIARAILAERHGDEIQAGRSMVYLDDDPARLMWNVERVAEDGGRTYIGHAWVNGQDFDRVRRAMYAIEPPPVHQTFEAA